MELETRFRAVAAQSPEDVLRAQRLRAKVFGLCGVDADGFDDLYTTVLIQNGGPDPVACFRYKQFAPSAGFTNSYAASHYDLQNFERLDQDVLELGRLAVDPAHNSPDILRVVWAFLTEYVDRHNIGLLFGCTSFSGVDPAPYASCFELLHHAHLAPSELKPLVKSPNVVRFASGGARPDVMAARKSMPSLLRSYLGMGGWVSDHAVVDPAMNTLHVLTGVEIAKIPEARKRLLRADAANL